MHESRLVMRGSKVTGDALRGRARPSVERPGSGSGVRFDVVRLWVDAEPDCIDGRRAAEPGLGDPVPAVHQAPVRRQITGYLRSAFWMRSECWATIRQVTGAPPNQQSWSTSLMVLIVPIQLADRRPTPRGVRSGRRLVHQARCVSVVQASHHHRAAS